MNLLQRLIFKLYVTFCRQKHKYPASCLVRRKNGDVVFEIEFNWYDEANEPVSVVRNVTTDKIFSIRHNEMHEFVEHTGNTDF